jgi:hypothetical protein
LPGRRPQKFFREILTKQSTCKITRFNATSLAWNKSHILAISTYLPETVVLPYFGVLFLLLSNLLIELRLLFFLLELLFSLLLLLLPPLVLLLCPRLLTDVSLMVRTDQKTIFVRGGWVVHWWRSV